MTQTQTFSVSENWLDTNTTNTAVGTTIYPIGDHVNTQVTVWPIVPINPWYYPVPSYCTVYSGPAKPIKLGLSEVERLRAAAKRDAKLKKILEKFTDLIEVTVDFE